MAQIPNGTDVCYYGYIQAKIGGYNGVSYLMVERDDGGPDVWSSNFVVGVCEGDHDEEFDWYKTIEENAGYLVLVALLGVAATQLIDV